MCHTEIDKIRSQIWWLVQLVEFFGDNGSYMLWIGYPRKNRPKDEFVPLGTYVRLGIADVRYAIVAVVLQSNLATNSS